MSERPSEFEQLLEASYRLGRAKGSMEFAVRHSDQLIANVAKLDPENADWLYWQDRILRDLEWISTTQKETLASVNVDGPTFDMRADTS